MFDFYPKYNNKKIVFLDIDGVICPYTNNSRWEYDLKELAHRLKNQYQDNSYLKMPDCDLGGAYYDWDKDALNRLREILELTESKIVLHSDLRFYNDTDSFRAMFRLHNMEHFVSDTCIDKFDKDKAINLYLKDNKQITNYVILDDDRSLEVFKDNFVLTHNIISEENIDQSIKILMKGSNG